jgi:hypothetical protein
VRAESMQLRLRPRGNMEACDLGIRLCQVHAADVYRCYLLVALPAMLICAATYPIASGLPVILIWWLKPWLDRTIMFVLSRAVFGQSTGRQDLWLNRVAVLGGQWLLHLTLRRLSPRRCFTQAAYQLEGLRGAQRRQRLRQLRQRAGGAGTGVTFVFANVELCLLLGLYSLLVLFAPEGRDVNLWQSLTIDVGGWINVANTVFYCLVVAFLEPLYVAAGFGLYLNRRVELEAWDIEQEFRRAFA